MFVVTTISITRAGGRVTATGGLPLARPLEAVALLTRGLVVHELRRTDLAVGVRLG